MKNYFEGWYFKHTFGEETLIFIPGYHQEHNQKKAFIQMIYNQEVHYFDFDQSEVILNKERIVEIAENKFSLDEIEINLENEKIKVRGRIKYQNITPLNYRIMGPFSYVPSMQCKHEILSLHHHCAMDITINDKHIQEEAIGYIEKDWGSSFPTRYCWLQGNDFDPKASVVLAIASIDYSIISFIGIIGVVYFNQQEIRIATYLGARVIKCNDSEIVVKQGKYRLEIKQSVQAGVELPAPINGSMKRAIHETIKTTINVKLFDGKQCIFNQTSMNASVEMVDMVV